MAVSFDSPTIELLESGNVQFRYLAKFVLTSGTYYFGNHAPGELISWDSQNWYGLGNLVSISELRTSTGLTADEMTLTLDASMLAVVPEGYEDASQWLRDILQEDMINRRCELYELYEHPRTGVATSGLRKFAGPIDKTPVNYQQGVLTIRVRSNRQALGWANGRTRSDADQRRVSATDGSLRHAAALAARGGTMPWGYVPTQSGTRSGGVGGGTGRGNPGTNYREV